VVRNTKALLDKFGWDILPHPPIAQTLRHQMWCAKLAYLADIFQKLNVLNSSMQGRKKNIISTSDKMESFKKNINLWLSCIKNDDFSCFSSVEESIIHLSINQKNGIKNIMYEHLLTLSRNLKNYFPSLLTTEIQWVVSLYVNLKDLFSFSNKMLT